jgi:hypothetical protein
MSEEPAANRLAGETSPYLLQHAHNPVDWYPWGEEALERAKREDKPVLLSIGYAACHWCHVMEEESFEDPETAGLMNERFVSIKVDREERPDVDAIYMDAVQAMTGGGGWPLTAFLTPKGEPFYAGTYFPNEDRHGLPAFRKILAAISDAWENRRDESITHGRRVVNAIARAGTMSASPDPLSDDVLRRAFDVLRRSFDHRWGGFGGAPKFPQPMTLPGDASDHPRPDSGRRHVRPDRWGLPPVLHGRDVARAALREGALRQRAARAAVHASMAGDARRTVPARRRRDLRVPAARDAASGRWLLLVAGCRFRGGRGQVLRLVLRRARLARR